MLSTRVLTLRGRTAAHACHSGGWVGGHPYLGPTPPIWSQTCSMGFRSRLWAGQPLTSTSFCARKAIVSRTVWGVALSWTCTNLVQNRLSPREAYYRGEAWCKVKGSIQHHHGGRQPIHHPQKVYEQFGLPQIRTLRCNYFNRSLSENPCISINQINFDL